jgi:alpha-1,2-mannosyltransferase
VSRLSIALFVLLFLHALAIPWALHVLAGTPRHLTIVGSAEQFAHRSQSDDSWRPMRAAKSYVLRSPGHDIYEEVFFHRHLKFQYPPTALLFTREFSNDRLNAISWLAVWLTATLAAALLVVSAADQKLITDDPRDRILTGLAAFGLCMTFYPLLKAYTLGQIQVWVDVVFAFATLAWWSGRRFVAGLSVGLACLIKPTLAPLALWGLIRREWQFLGGIAIVAAAGFAVAIASFGLSSNLSYLRVLSFIAPRGEAYYPNQSINGLLNRWLGNGSILEFDDFAFSPYHPWVAWGTAVTSAALLVAALSLPFVRRAVDRRLEFAVVALTATIASPIVWEHHYGIALPIFAMAMPIVVAASPAGRATPLLLALSFVLIAQYFHEAQRFASTPWNPLQSYTLFGALLFLSLLYGSIIRTRTT